MTERFRWDTPGDPDSDRLADDLLWLAESPDDDAVVDVLLERIAVAAADVLPGVVYASITAWRGAGYTTVAASSDLARAVDDAQHAESAGPCVQAAQTAAPVSVPDIAMTMSWPAFHRRATELGLRASVSVPLFAGGGAPVAVLNLYGHDPEPLAALTEGVHAVFASDRLASLDADRDGDEGTRQFLFGLGHALQVRATIQQAVGVVMARDGCAAEQAYRRLRQYAATAQESLSSAATWLITGVVTDPEAGVQVSVRQLSSGVLRVTLTGELAAPVDPAVPARLRAVLDEPASTVHLDLSGVGFCDVAGLRVLLELGQQAAAAGRQLLVVEASYPVRVVLRLTGTAAYFRYPPAPDSAGT
jgi:anti-anti-sigma factor